MLNFMSMVYLTDNHHGHSVGHIRIRIQDKNFKMMCCSIYLYLVLRRAVLMKGQ